MRKHLVACGSLLGAVFAAWAVFGQTELSPTPSETPNISLQPSPVIAQPSPLIPPPSPVIPSASPIVPQPTPLIPEPSLPPQPYPSAPERGVVEESSTFEYS